MKKLLIIAILFSSMAHAASANDITSQEFAYMKEYICEDLKQDMRKQDFYNGELEQWDCECTAKKYTDSLSKAELSKLRSVGLIFLGRGWRVITAEDRRMTDSIMGKYHIAMKNCGGFFRK